MALPNSATPQRLQRLLIARPDRIGDVILSSSCLPALHAQLPQAELFYAAQPVMEPLFRHHPFAHFIALPDPQLPFLERVKMLRSQFETNQFDCIISLHPDAAIYLASFLARVPRRIGYPLRGLSWTLTDSVPERRGQALVHEAVSNFDLLQPLGVSSPPVLRASIDPPPQKLFPEVKAPYVCLHLGAFSEVARWPVAHFIELARRVHRERNMQIILIGSAHDLPAHEEFKTLATDFPYLDFAGRLNLAELGSLLRGAACLVVRDTGPSHLAAAVECPVVVLFGRLKPPYGPTRWAPLADADKVRVISTTSIQKPRENRDTFFRRAFAEIPVEAVLTAIDEIMKS